MSVKLLLGDCKDKLKELEDNSIDLVVTDPPYGYSFMGKDWDTFNEVTDLSSGGGGAFGDKKGFKKLPRNKPNGMLEFFVPIWEEVLRVMKPGGFAFVMCAPRQDVLARQVVALQDAGFDTGFTSLYWTYASGFPKAHNISKEIDKQAGKEREVIAEHPLVTQGFFDKVDEKGRKYHQSDEQGYKIYEYKGTTVPATEEAKQYNGAYGGYQPKPAVEVILVVMKPMDEKTYVAQVLKNGKGCTWLDDCRIPYKDEPTPEVKAHDLADDSFSYSFGATDWTGSDKGRFPANLLVSDDVLDDGKIGKSTPGTITAGGSAGLGEVINGHEFNSPYNDQGTFSRFFSLDEWADRNLPFLIVPKASKAEKNEGCGHLNDKVGGGMEGTRDQTLKTGSGNERNNIMKNNHPTVKPMKLMAYLIIMGSREGDKVLDPFMGSGTTGIAAKKLARDFVGIEMDPDYFEIAEARIDPDQTTLFD